jgi:hypothetical protein
MREVLEHLKGDNEARNLVLKAILDVHLFSCEEKLGSISSLGKDSEPSQSRS